MKIIKLDVREDSELEGIDAVALVENPAIEVDFQAFAKHKFQSYNDYPQAARKAAEQGIKRNKALGNKCGTAVGKRRATQLANGENVSIDTIKRMRAFLIRQRDNYDLAVKRKDYDACGYISYLLWGGPSALPWAEKKLRQAGLLEEQNEKIIRDAMSQQQGFADIKAIEGVPVFQSENDALKVAEMIGCGLNVHQHEVEGALYYMPCSTHQEAIDKLKNDPNKFFDELDDDKQELLLKALDNVGLTQDSLESDGWVEMSEEAFHNNIYHFVVTSEPERGSLQDTNLYRILYKYQGPRDSKNRSFCREVLTKDLLYRIEDINNMSLRGENEEFGTYDIFSYKGSYNCRHRWVQKFFRKTKALDEQKRATTSNTGPREVIGGPRVQEASQTNPKSRTQAEVEAGVEAGVFQFSAVDSDEQILVGPLMIPDRLIPRLNAEGEKYYVFFDAEGIQKMSYKLMKNKYLDQINIEHDDRQKVDNINLVESWLIEDPKKDKATLYGYDLPKGSWMAKYKVDNKKVWDEFIKTGRVKGFSVEGIFNDKLISNFTNANS